MNQPSPRLARITRVSRSIALTCTGLFFILPLFLAALSFVYPQILLIQRVASQFSLSPEDLSLVTITAAYGAIMVSSAPMLWALWSARRLFQSYAAGAVFTREAANSIKHIAYALLAMVIVRPVGTALFSLALSTAVPTGQKKLVFQFGSDEVWIGLAGAMVLVIAWIMGEAAAMAEENKSFV